MYQGIVGQAVGKIRAGQVLGRFGQNWVQAERLDAQSQGSKFLSLSRGRFCDGLAPLLYQDIGMRVCLRQISFESIEQIVSGRLYLPIQHLQHMTLASKFCLHLLIRRQNQDQAARLGEKTRIHL